MIKTSKGKMYYPVIDGHADTLVRISEEDGSLGQYNERQHIDLPRLLRAGVDLQVMAICAANRENPYSWAKSIISRWGLEYEVLKEKLIWIRTGSDFANWEKGGKTGIILAMEGLEPLEGELSRINEFFELGIRMISLTWNRENQFASGVNAKKDWGLTALGKQVVKIAEDLGIILDLSHLGKKSFIDLINIVREPVCVTHANVFEVLPHIRNLNTEQIKMIASTGGTVGLTFYPPFINRNKVKCMDLIPHLEEVIKVAGEDCPALGSDFDGIEITPEDLRDVTGLPYFLDQLEDYGFNEGIINKFAGGNLYRFLKKKFSKGI